MQQVTATRPEARTRGTLACRWPAVKDLAAFTALIVLILVFWVLNPGTFATLPNVQIVLEQAALPLVIGVGATLVILMGSIDLSVEGVMGAAGMTFVLLSTNSRQTTTDLGWWAIAVAVAVGMALGLLTGLIHTRLRVPSFLVTLGVWSIGLGIATILSDRSVIPSLLDSDPTRWARGLTLGLPNQFLLAALVVLAGVAAARFTRVERVAYAIGKNLQIAQDDGLPVNRYKIYVFVVAGACSALAGVLATLQLGAGSATIGNNTLSLTLAAVVIGGTSLGGGKGGILRTAVGVMLLVVLNNGLILSGVSANVQPAVSGAVLVLAITAAAWPDRSRLWIVR